MTDSGKARGEQLDALNRATFRSRYRDILDRGVGDGGDSALAGLLDGLRANAETACGEAPKRAPKAS